MFNETHPITHMDRDVAVAASRGTLGQVAPQSETLEDATEKLIAEYVRDNAEEVVDDVHEESTAAQLLQEAEMIAVTPIAREEQAIIDASAPVLQAEFIDMKRQVNDSLSELANLLLEHQRGIEQINERLETHNQRSGHKI